MLRKANPISGEAAFVMILLMVIALSLMTHLSGSGITGQAVTDEQLAVSPLVIVSILVFAGIVSLIVAKREKIRKF